MKFSKIVALIAVAVAPVAFGCVATVEDPGEDVDQETAAVEESGAAVESAATAEEVDSTIGVSEEALVMASLGCPSNPFRCDRYCRNLIPGRGGRGFCVGPRQRQCVCQR
ncbi:hypothetical protein [Polyangium aurulentum]|uniref:hypothetical protein n=1 Tax=Polyangium aurulentum TaxID=2567896 RepID=UPI00146DFD26|nr:hypothetical protein [Polyangium aurulentum]UQA59908.1 hypothetical protein E8A73_005290 [Polyangium aurulentum]